MTSCPHKRGRQSCPLSLVKMTTCLVAQKDSNFYPENQKSQSAPEETETKSVGLASLRPEEKTVTFAFPTF